MASGMSPRGGRRPFWRYGAAVRHVKAIFRASVGAVAVFIPLVVACGTPPAAVPDDPEVTLPKRGDNRDAGIAEEPAEGGNDAALARDAAPDAAKDAGPQGPCSGKTDGTAYAPEGPQGRCCSGEPAKINTNANCGGCGIRCGAGAACEEFVVGHYACTCGADSACIAAGYGPKATCYAAGGSYCNCQCPGGASSCANQCAGGATCHVMPGNNYCGY